MNVQKNKVTQFVLPRGFVGRVTLMFMNRGHKAIYENVAEILKLQPEDELLEVACGNGYFLRKYASHVHSIACIDLSELAVKLAINKNKERVAAGTAEFLRGEASQLPWEDGKFSVATCMGSFPGFSKPLDSLKEIYRVLRPSGRAVISIEWNAEDGKDHSKEVEKHGYQIWNETEVRKMFKDVGFADISITYAKGLMMPKMMIAHGVK
jgi:SAM-dependent methyltransferase